MSETDWSQASKPIPPFGFPSNDAALSTARAGEASEEDPKPKPFKARAIKTTSLETKAIEAGTLETLRSLSQQSSALAIAIDYSDQPVSATQTVITPTSERFSDALEIRTENATESIPAESRPAGLTLATEPEITEPEITEPKSTEPEATEPEITEPEATDSETTPNALPNALSSTDALIAPDRVSTEIVKASSFLTHGNEASAVVATSAPHHSSEASQTLAQIPESSPAAPLYFLIVNYHNAALISDLLHTLEANQGIVLINNSPVDRVIHRLAGQTYANGTVTVLDAPNNMGFSAACNLGLEWIYARSPNALVWLIKSDAQLVPRAVASVRQCFTQRPDLAILGTPILNASGKPWFTAGKFNPWLGLITSRRLGKADVLGRPIPTRWVSSGSMVFNFAVLGHCPQFDETYFLYYEDCDLCERYFQQGVAIALTPSPLIVRSGTTALSRYTYPRHTNAAFSRLTFLSRHGTPVALALNLLMLSVKALVLKVHHRPASQGCWQGIQNFLQHRD